MVRVSVEYCGSCGYKPRYEELAKLIKAGVPNAEVTGFTGRTGSFEVEANGKKIFSKLQEGSFPNMERIVETIKTGGFSLADILLEQHLGQK